MHGHEFESPVVNNIPIGFGYPGSIGAGAAQDKGGAGNGRQGFGPGLYGGKGSQPLDDGRPGWGSVAAFKDPPPDAPAAGPAPSGGIGGNQEAAPGGYTIGPNPIRLQQFIPPLAMFNDASQWVNHLLFHRVLPWLMNPDSNPPLRAQYAVGPRPINVHNAAAGQMNLQLQLGNLTIQAEALTMDASNYFGG
jgi:hypothetical protein